MLALAAGIAELGDRRGRIGAEPLEIGGIAPGLGDDARAVPRPDLGLIGLRDRIDRRGIEVALLDQDGFQRLHPERDLRQGGTVVVSMVVRRVIVIVHGGSLGLDLRKGR